jgi:hypothetical protein
MLRKTMIMAAIVCCMSSAVFCAPDEAIGPRFKDKDVVKVYVKDVSNASGQSLVTARDFKAIIETSLLKRRSMTFKMVSTAAQSDIQISAIIEKFQYLVRGPLKPSLGIETTLLDAAATATMNYVEMAANFTVIDTVTGNVLWKDGVENYLKKMMTLEESVPMISDKITRDFIWHCFGKANHRSRKGFVLN